MLLPIINNCNMVICLHKNCWMLLQAKDTVKTCLTLKIHFICFFATFLALASEKNLKWSLINWMYRNVWNNSRNDKRLLFLTEYRVSCEKVSCYETRSTVDRQYRKEIPKPIIYEVLIQYFFQMNNWQDCDRFCFIANIFVFSMRKSGDIWQGNRSITDFYRDWHFKDTLSDLPEL